MTPREFTAVALWAMFTVVAVGLAIAGSALWALVAVLAAVALVLWVMLLRGGV